MDATKKVQETKTETLQETRHAESVPTTTTVSNNPTLVLPAMEKSILPTYERGNSTMSKFVLQLKSFEMFNLAKNNC